jgi:peptidoglycan/LPS O-acetylase OafA/YrhL
MSDLSKKVYFFGLNEVRAMAALSVVFYHIESYKNREGKFSLYDIHFFKSFIKNLGHNGVTCFFVLSGFLITYLLLIEKQKYGTIKIREFYIRRILRIWPLYFLVVIIGFMVMPLINKFSLFQNQTFCPNLIDNINYSSIFLFILFLSNLSLIFYKPVVAASQSWSVSVEEQFYLIWPWIIKNNKSISRITITILCIFLFKFSLDYMLLNFFGNQCLLYKILKVIEIEYMCVGALGAILLFTNKYENINRVLTSNFFGAFIVLLIGFEFFTYNHKLVLAFLFFLFIYFIIHKKIEVKPLNFLGKISYGIYMFHPLFNFIGFSVSVYLFPNSILAYNIVYYSFTFGFTIILSYLSFKYFENYFLNIKNKYTLIKSGS